MGLGVQPRRRRAGPRRRVGPPARAPLPEAIARFAARLPFPLDPFQIDALRALDGGQSVLAAAPTGSGKTIIAEFGIELARAQGLRAIYTAPIKALSNQKFRDWTAQYGDTVGLLTGDVTVNPDGRIMVMTTEVLRNMLVQSPHELDDAGCVIFDEVHFLADPDRGTTWEEAILYCPKHVQLVCLSATVANAAEIASWISLVHRETILITHDERVVPLEHYYFVDGDLHRLIDSGGEPVEPLRIGGESRYPRPPGIPGGARPRPVPRPREVVQRLDEASMLPAIYFLFGRRLCEVAAADCIALDLISSRAARRARRERIDAYLSLLDPEDRQLEQVQRLVALLQRGIAFHHAGLLPLLKGLVEELFAAGLVGVVFATETLALGINMPARSVVIAEPTKFDGESRRPLLPNEYAQLVGRAGRRGVDPMGYAVNLYSPWMTCAEVLEIARGKLLPVRSAFTPRYNTVATLWDGTPAGRERLVRLFASSLRQFQMNDALKTAAAEVEDLRERAAAAHFRCPYEGIPDEAVVEYLGLRRQLSEARKHVQRTAAVAAAARRERLRPPWPVPPPDQVRREFQRFAGGEVIYLSGTRGWSPGEDGDSAVPEPQPGTWAVFVRRYRGGPGLVLVDHRVEAVARWADVTWLPEGKPAIDLPEALRAVPGPVDDVRALIGAESWEAIQASLRRLDLPDLPAREARRLAALGRDEAAAGYLSSPAAVAELEAAVKAHPCDRCPVRREHERALRREHAVLRQLADAEAHAADLEADAASQAERTLDALTNVLTRFGFLERVAMRPTDKSAVLARVYDPNGVLLVHLAWNGAFDHLAPAELMELLSWFAYDREGLRWNRHHLTTRLWELRDQLPRWVGDLQRAETDLGLAITSGPSLAFYGPALAWGRGASFADLLERMPISEGDLLLTLNKTLDLATQLREALRQGAPQMVEARNLAAKLEVGDGLLRRGIVAQSLRLATGVPGVNLPPEAPAAPRL